MNEITLRDVLPAVFADEPMRPSEVWRSRLSFRRGEYYTLVAASGAGKSSLCSFLYGVRRDYKGEIICDGDNIRRYDIAKWVDIRQHSIAYLPQGMDIFPELTARENIQLKNQLTGYKTMRQVEDMAAALGIAHKLDKPARLLSIGQLQRVALVRTLCQPCDFFLLDEPVSHLDADNNLIAAHLVMDEARAVGAGIITTSVGNHMLISDAHQLSL